MDAAAASADVARAVERLHRQEFGRALAAVISLIGDFQIAEDAVQDALVAALEQWPRGGIPAQQRAWLVGTARHKAIDRIRRHARFAAKQRELEALAAADAAANLSASTDDGNPEVPDDIGKIVGVLVG